MILESLDFEYAEARKATLGTPPMPKGLNTSIDITNAVVRNKGLDLNFAYLVTYIPDKSFIRINGKARFKGPDVRKAYAEWKKTRNVSGKPGEQLINAINYSASLNSIFIARVFNLTPPVIPPSIRFGKPGPIKSGKKK